MDTALLEDIGFTKSEIKVYLALLRLGNVTSGPVIRESCVARSKVYELLERLRDKGLVTESVEQNTRHFQATDPDRILEFIRQKEERLEQQAKDFEAVLPELRLQQTLATDHQEAKVYVGFEGVKSFYEEILRQLGEGDEYLAITFHDESVHFPSLGLFFHKFHQRRAEKKVRARILANIQDRKVRSKLDFSDTPLYEFRLTDQQLPASHAIFRDTVAFFHWGKTPRVFVMVCRDNADQYRKFFDAVWKKAK